MKKLIPLLVLCSISAHANVCASKARATQIAGLFAEGGSCATLPEGSRDAIRNYSTERALDTFRGIKSVWLDNFSTTQQWTLGYELGLIYATTQQPQQIFNLFRAVDLMRPNGGTTPAHVAGIQAALDAINANELNPHAREMLYHTIAGLGAIRSILSCRLADQELAARMLEAQTECPADQTPLPSRAEAYSVFIGPVTQTWSE